MIAYSMPCLQVMAAKKQFTDSLTVAEYQFRLKSKFVVGFGGSLRVFEFERVLLVSVH